jgi:hypothetical protein
LPFKLRIRLRWRGEVKIHKQANEKERGLPSVIPKGGTLQSLNENPAGFLFVLSAATPESELSSCL